MGSLLLASVGFATSPFAMWRKMMTKEHLHAAAELDTIRRPYRLSKEGGQKPQCQL